MIIRQLFNISPQPSNRLAWMDYAKGIAIFMVVYRHLTIGMQLGGLPIDKNFFEIVNQAGLTFRMPLFFLLSGIFFRMSIRKHSEAGYALHKSKTIVYPYLIWALIFTSLQVTMSNYTNSNASLWSYLDIFIDPWGHWWFLPALFNVSILYLVLFLLSKGNKLVLLFTGLLLYFTANYLLEFSMAFHIMRLFIFFVVGDLISSFVLDKKHHTVLASPWLLALSFTCALAGEWLLFSGHFHSDNGQEIWRNGTLPLLIFSLVGSYTIMSASYQLALLKPGTLSIIRVFGQHSLYIYLLHSIIGAGVRITLVSMFGFYNYWLVIGISLLACLMLPVILFRLSRQLGFWLLFTPELPFKTAVPKATKSHTNIPVTK